VEANLIADSLDLGVTPAVEEALYRIAQEMLNNVLNHAGATEVVVSVGVEDGAVELAVRDNGCGFDPQVAQERGGMGLANMRQRVEVLAGSMAISSVPGKGTEIRASVPMARPLEHGQELAG
jgi:signal transduction histidine kinase